jgi:HAD superfamily hydrolase (TIGR01490 family)
MVGTQAGSYERAEAGERGGPLTPPPDENSQRAAAFFDLDKTLMAGSSGFQFGRAVRRAGMVSRRQMLRWGVDHLRFRLRGSTDEEATALLEHVKGLLEGVRRRDLARLMPELMSGILPRIYPPMLAEVHAHQDAGRATFIISAAAHGLVELLARVLDMEGGIGTDYEVGPDGRLTGDLSGPFMYGEGKLDAMRNFAAEHEIDLAVSWAYSDSVSDLPMLSAVGNPVVVNPDPALAAIAREQGWRVMRFEKLGRRLAVAGALLVAALIGGTGTWIASRRGSITVR